SGHRQWRSHRNLRHRYGVYGILRSGDAHQYAGEPVAHTVGRRPGNRWLEATDTSLTRLTKDWHLWVVPLSEAKGLSEGPVLSLSKPILPAPVPQAQVSVM